MDESKIKAVNVRDLGGMLLWEDPTWMPRMGVGDDFVRDYIQYRVTDQALVDGVLHLNVKRVRDVREE